MLIPSSHKTIKHHHHHIKYKYKNKEIALKLHIPSLSQRPKTSRNINTQTSLLSAIPPSFYKSSYSNNIKTISSSSTTTTPVHPCPNISNITLRQHILTKSTLSYDTNNINTDRSHSISSQCKVNNITMEFQPEPIDPIYLLYYPNNNRTIRNRNMNSNSNNSCSNRSRNKIKHNNNNNNIKQCQTFNNTVNVCTTGFANTKRRLLNLTTNKLLFANIATSKKYFLLSQLQCDDNNTNTTSNSNSNEPVKYINELKRKYGIKKSSLIDRYIFKIVNPEGIIEDFITEDESKPSDKYKRLRNQISKGRNKVYRIIQDIKRKQMITDTAFKIPLRRSKIQLTTTTHTHDVYYLNSNN